MKIVFYLLINLPINTYIKLQQMLNYVYYRKFGVSRKRDREAQIVYQLSVCQQMYYYR